MITLFKIFENVNPPKFEVGDIVYNIGPPVFRVNNPIKCKVVEVIPESERPDNKGNRYILDLYPPLHHGTTAPPGLRLHLSVREDVLISEYEFDAKKYNI